MVRKQCWKKIKAYVDCRHRHVKSTLRDLLGNYFLWYALKFWISSSILFRGKFQGAH